MLKECFKMILVKGKVDLGPTSILRVIHSVERTFWVFMMGLVQFIGRGVLCSLFPYCGWLMVLF